MNRREKGLARTGNARVRCGMIQLAWRVVRFTRIPGGRGIRRSNADHN
jgi:hypothetical protein